MFNTVEEFGHVWPLDVSNDERSSSDARTLEPNQEAHWTRLNHQQL